MINQINQGTINILIGPFTTEYITKSKQGNYNLYKPDLITDAVKNRKFDRKILDVYKWEGKSQII